MKHRFATPLFLGLVWSALSIGALLPWLWPEHPDMLYALVLVCAGWAAISLHVEDSAIRAEPDTTGGGPTHRAGMAPRDI